MRIQLCIFLILLAANTVAASDVHVPKGWRLPTEKDMSGDWAEFRKDNPHPYLAQADFNGDGIPDDAYIALAVNGKSWALFVNLNKKKSPPKVLKLDEDNGETPPQRMGLDIAEPGTYKTACGKGYWECDKDETETLKLRVPAIDFYLFESANSFFWWDKKLGHFRRTWMSD
ncbi:hypothetical protein KI811_11960 [Geobacter hydrogenophilus]|nr:hypothetical protein [Geobacter hydrogenophilus]MBT0894524.1 hypothetical protein [Geobacter hydrogenophilus]